MQIKIDTYNCGEIDQVSVTATGEQSSRGLLAMVLPQAKPKPDLLGSDPALDACTLREAIKLFRAMSATEGARLGGACHDVADLLENLADGTNKINIIRGIREVGGMGLTSAKSLSENYGPFRFK